MIKKEPLGEFAPSTLGNVFFITNFEAGCIDHCCFPIPILVQPHKLLLLKSQVPQFISSEPMPPSLQSFMKLQTLLMSIHRTGFVRHANFPGHKLLGVTMGGGVPVGIRLD
jgi:hypothetical protein